VSPPKVRSYSASEVVGTGSSTGPRAALPTNAATAVATPVIVRLPLGISWM
jgi:hypothetical protein